MYDALTVARYIVNYGNTNNLFISNLELQKILYFSQCFYLDQFDKRLFSDDIVAWNFGPIIRSVYKEFQAYQTVRIPYVKKYYETDDLNEKPKFFNDSIVSDEDKYIINQIVDFFAQFTLVELTQIVHNQKPWKKTYQEGKDNIITVSCIKKNF